MSFTRRKLLVATALTAPVLLLGACSSSSTQAVSAAATDVATIAKGLAAVVPQLESVVGIPAATVTKIQTYANDLQSAATAISTAASSADQQSAVNQVVTAVNGLVAAASAFSAVLPSPVSTGLAAASVLLPVIEAAVGLTPSTSARMAMATPITAAAASMNPDQARLILTGLAAK